MKTGSDRYDIQNYRRVLRVLLVPTAALLLLLPVFSAVRGAPRERPSMNISVSPSTVWPGESCLLRIQVRNLPQGVTPDLDYLNEEFDVQFIGSEPLSHSMTITINGKTTVTEERGETFVYRLTPKRGGTIQIEPPIIESDGIPLSAPPAILRVIEPADVSLPPEKRSARLEVSVSPGKIYPLSPFTVTLSVYIREESEKKNPTSPLLKTGDRNPPELLFDWGLDEKLPQGFEPDEEFSQWMEEYVSSRGGFSINRLRRDNPFSLFGGDPRLLTFLPKGKLVRAGEGDDASRFWRYDFTRSFTAGEAGTYSMPPAILKGILGGREIYAASGPVSVTVREIPQPRPEGYIGVVGRGGESRVAARLSSNEGRVGEAITLELTLTGTSGAANLGTPDPSENETVKKRFKIYDPTEERTSEAIRWRWNLRPLTPGNEAFPALSLAVFDAAAGEFKEFQTDEIPLIIEAGSADLESFTQDVASAESEVPVSRTGSPKPLGRVPMTFPLGGMALWAGILYTAVCAIGAIRYTRRVRKTGQDTALVRKGERMIHKAFSEGAGAVHRAVVTAFLTPLTAENSRADALSRGEIDTLLAKRTERTPDSKFEKLAAEFGSLLDRLEAEKFAGADAAVTEAEVNALYRRWTAALKERGFPRTKKSAGGTLGILLIPLLLTLSGCKPDLETHEEFDRAVALYGEAENSDATDGEKALAFRQSAAVYEGLLAEGKENGAILYNLGCAYRSAGDNPRALAAWRRAESYIPRDGDLKAAIAGIKPAASGEKNGLLDTILFRQLIPRPAQERIFLALTLAAALLTAASFFAPGRHGKTLRRLAAGAFLISLLLFGSMALDRCEQARRGIATAEAELRKGSGTAYEQIGRLRELDECQVLDSHRGWLRVRGPDGITGWVEAEKILPP